MNLRKSLEAERVYTYITVYLAQYGIPPRRKDIGPAIDFTFTQLDRALLRLRGAGRICEGSTLPRIYTDPLPRGPQGSQEKL